MFGPLEIAIVVLLAAVLFGAKRLPELGKNLGQGIGEFKRSTRDLRLDIEDVLRDETDPRKS
jgi:sec-independent protein translocase protein TatA